ncbi:MAG: PilN domain-containing protein [Deltaproteobacteria bacterium]|nr:PilN domain-containing protein [Deltaproteobacteria bacterium]
MIRINLLHEKKKAKRAGRGEQVMALGFAAVGLVAACLYVFVHMPLSEEVEKAQQANTRLRKSIRDLTDQTKDFDVINQQFQQVQEQGEAIERLNNARAVPAWLLRELSSVLTKDHKPTMTREMTERVKADHNRQWTQGWDPKRIWIESFEEKEGAFTLKGGAQSDGDVTQLALRLQASVYFTNVVPEGGQSDVNKESNVGYYRFTISGKVAY